MAKERSQHDRIEYDMFTLGRRKGQLVDQLTSMFILMVMRVLILGASLGVEEANTYVVYILGVQHDTVRHVMRCWANDVTACEG